MEYFKVDEGAGYERDGRKYEVLVAEKLLDQVGDGDKLNELRDYANRTSNGLCLDLVKTSCFGRLNLSNDSLVKLLKISKCLEEKGRGKLVLRSIPNSDWDYLREYFDMYGQEGIVLKKLK